MRRITLSFTLGLLFALPACGGGSSGAGAGGGGGAGGGASGGAGGGAGGGAPTAWYQQIRGPQNDRSMSIAIANNGEVTIAGSTNGATDFGAGSTALVSHDDIFVARYAPEGSLMWAKRFGALDALAVDVELTPDGGAYVLGHYGLTGPVFGEHVLPPVANDKTDLLLVALDASGEPRWARRMGGEGYDFAGRLAIAPDGGVAVAAESSSELYIARFSSDGSPVFERKAGSLTNNASSFAAVQALAFDSQGNLLITGEFTSSTLLDGVTLTKSGFSDVFLARFDGNDGALSWAHRYGGAASSFAGPTDIAHALVPLDGGDFLISGCYMGAADFGGGPLDMGPSGASSGAFVARLGPGAEHRWSVAIDSDGCATTRLGLDPEGRATLVGAFRMPVTIGGTSQEPGTLVATFDAETGAFIAVSPLPEIGTSVSSTQNGYFGLGDAVVGPKGQIVVETSFYESITTSLGTFKSDGWDDVLLVYLPR